MPRSQYYTPLKFTLTPSKRPCVFGACMRHAYVELRHYCIQHFGDVVVKEAERRVRALNQLWLRAGEAEQRDRVEWRCTCGFIGTYNQREEHFIENPSYDHLPTSKQRYKELAEDMKTHTYEVKKPRAATAKRPQPNVVFDD